MPFVAQQAPVQPLGWNFYPYVGEDIDHPIPEPPTHLVVDYWNALADREDWARHEAQKAIREQTDAVEAERAQRPTPDSPQTLETDEERERRIQGLLAENRHVMEEARRRLAEAMSAVCSGSPSVDELLALPERIFRAFDQYLVEELNPEGSGGNGSSN
jgi:hypothetical protein